MTSRITGRCSFRIKLLNFFHNFVYAKRSNSNTTDRQMPGDDCTKSFLFLPKAIVTNSGKFELDTALEASSTVSKLKTNPEQTGLYRYANLKRLPENMKNWALQKVFSRWTGNLRKSLRSHAACKTFSLFRMIAILTNVADLTTLDDTFKETWKNSSMNH